MAEWHPQARHEGVLSEDLDGELLVFDTRASRAHSLNSTAARVWRACDGAHTPTDLAIELALPAEAVQLALDSLAGTDLLIDPPAATHPGISRRTALRRIAAAGAAGTVLPVIRSVAAPSLALAGSTAGSPCSSAGTVSAGNPGGCPATSYCDSRGTCHPGVPIENSLRCRTPDAGSCLYGSSCQSGEAENGYFCLET